MKERKEESLKNIELFIKRFNHVHISFDIDVFDKTLVSATGTPAKKGFNKKEIFEILEIIKRNLKSFSLDLAEVNPKKKEANQTVKLAQEVILEILS